jgi:hypothetical protein
MKSCLHFLLFFVPLMSYSQERLLPSLVETAPKANRTLIETNINQFISIQKERKLDARSEIKFLKSMVNASHKKFLKTYKAYSPFSSLFENGEYDCLSGTSFFSVVLDELQFRYKIIETNYHIFLLIETGQGQVLLETTDRFFGFKTNPIEIEKSLSHYKENLMATGSSDKRQYYKYHVDLFHEVSSRQLSGLLYFNQAVVAFNSHDWIGSTESLYKAKLIYDNVRVKELTEILITAIESSNLNSYEKQELLNKLKKDNKSQYNMLAVR